MARTKSIETPEELEYLFNQYVEWCNANPYKVHDFVGKDATEVYRERKRPVTWIGFETWLYENGVVYHLGNYEQNANGAYDAYLPIIRTCKRRCSTDIINGALVGIYQQNIAARLEGLKEQSESEVKVTPLPKIEFEMPPKDE